MRDEIIGRWDNWEMRDENDSHLRDENDSHLRDERNVKEWNASSDSLSNASHAMYVMCIVVNQRFPWSHSWMNEQ